MENKQTNEITLESLASPQLADFDTTVKELISCINEGVTGETTPCKVLITPVNNSDESKEELYNLRSTIFIRESFTSFSNRIYFFEGIHFKKAKETYNTISADLEWKKRKINGENFYEVTVITTHSYFNLKINYGNDIYDIIDVPFIVNIPKKDNPN